MIRSPRSARFVYSRLSHLLDSAGKNGRSPSMTISIIGSPRYDNMKLKHNTSERGYILLMSVLIVSVILSISFGIYALSIKDVILASYLKDSAKAFGAADKGVECALYWDRSTPQNGRAYTIFTTSTQYVVQPTGGSVLPPICDSVQLDTLPSWSAVNTPANTGTTNFSLCLSMLTAIKLPLLNMLFLLIRR